MGVVVLGDGRIRRGQNERKGHATRNGVSAALAAGIAASVGALIFWRRRRDAGDAFGDVQ